MGKGDRRSRRGKLFRGTFGKTRKHSSDTPARVFVAAPKTPEVVEEQMEPPKKKRSPRKKAE